jgi:hypothetical protein
MSRELRKRERVGADIESDSSTMQGDPFGLFTTMAR